MEKHHKFSIWYVLLGIWFVFILNNMIYNYTSPTRLAYSEFLDNLRKDRVKEIAISDQMIAGTYVDKDGKDTQFTTVRVSPDLAKELEGHQVKFRGEVESAFLRNLLSWVVPIFLFVGIWYFMMKRMGPGAGVMQFGSSRAKVYAEEGVATRFDDVAGVDEAKG